MNAFLQIFKEFEAGLVQRDVLILRGLGFILDSESKQELSFKDGRSGSNRNNLV